MESVTVWAMASVALATLAWRELGHRRAIKRMRRMLADSRADATKSEELATVGALVSDLAQELKRPLQGVLGNTELMLMSAGRGESGAEELREIRDNATLAAGIVRNLLAFTDTTMLKRSWHDVNDIVARAAVTCRMEVDAARIRIDVAPAPRLPLVYVDGRQLEKVLATLVGRAGRSDQLGRGARLTVVTVTAHRRTQPDDRLLIDIDDDGEVAPPPDEAFGIGGLAACTKIVEAHGGTVLVAPRSRGMHVHLEFPVTAVAAGRGLAAPHRDAAASSAMEPGTEPIPTHEETSTTWTTSSTSST